MTIEQGRSFYRELARLLYKHRIETVSIASGKVQFRNEDGEPVTGFKEFTNDSPVEAFYAGNPNASCTR